MTDSTAPGEQNLMRIAETDWITCNSVKTELRVNELQLLQLTTSLALCQKIVFVTQDNKEFI